MALHRGIQSAIFYYLSCAPCAEVKYRKRRKQEAKWDRENRLALEMDNPSLYRHPSPSSTNPFWQFEREHGPHGRRKKKTANSAAAVAAPVDGRGRVRATTVTTAESRDGRLSSNGRVSNAEGSLVNSVDGGPSHTRGPKYQQEPPYMRYQREDERLWGSTSTIAPQQTNVSAETIQRPPTAMTASSGGRSKCYPDRNPGINDLHPATVRKISSRSEVAWMMQPPPVADVMTGRQQPSRSGSDSGGSRPSVIGSQPLSRQVSYRIVEEKLKAGQSPARPLVRGKSVPNGLQLAVRGHGRQRSLTAGNDSYTRAIDGISPKRGVPTPQLQSQSGPSAAVFNRPSQITPEAAAQDTFVNQQQMPYASAKSGLPIKTWEDRFRDEESRPHTPRPIHRQFQSSSSLVNQRVDTPTNITQAGTTAYPKFHDRHTHFHQLADDDTTAFPTDEFETVDDEILDTWNSPDFDLHTWVTEHTKRDVRHRWSMDI